MNRSPGARGSRAADGQFSAMSLFSYNVGAMLSIVIPALNEEEALPSTLARTLAAAKALRSSSGMEVEILLVDDGSQDRTAEIARSFEGVRLLSHGTNRGYGAAIKTGFSAAKGEWLGFLDADGTCDPEFFARLLDLAIEGGYDVVLGSRMHGASKMPALRRLGNLIFRTLLNLLSGGEVTDTASGMRLLKRSALERLYPLPDGLNFTPAMSVRAVMDPGLRIGEIPMPYEERLGRSKLSVLKDGFRFLGIILQTAATYRPSTFFGCAASGLAGAALPPLFLSLGGPSAPVPFYLSNGRIEDWMIFRLILVSVFLGSSVFLLSLGLVAQNLVDLIHRGEDPFASGGFRAALLRRFPALGLLSLALAVWINRRPLSSWLACGRIPLSPGQEFWVFPVVGAMFTLIGMELLGFSALNAIARLLWEREHHRRGRGEGESS